MSEKTETNNRKAVYTIVEREGHKPFWLRIGVAFVNKDGSLNLILQALPLDGKLHVRDFPSREEGESPPF